MNRLLIPYLTSAMEMVDRGDATVRDIDVSMQLGAGHPMGPLHLSDYIGKECLYIYIYILVESLWIYRIYISIRMICSSYDTNDIYTPYRSRYTI